MPADNEHLRRCKTCPHAGVMADLEEILTAMSDDGTFRPTIKRVYHELKKRHPDWAVRSPYTLGQHMDRHDHDRHVAFFAR